MENNRMKLHTKCPYCGSSATRSRTVVYSSGTSTFSGRSSSRGISFNLSGRKRPRIWLGSGNFTGVRQSLIAQSAGPIPYFPCLFLIVVVFLLSGPQAAPLLVIALALWFVFSFYHNNTRYLNEWVCGKCGTFFDPKKIFEYQISSRCNEIASELNQLAYKIYYPNTEHERTRSVQRASSLLDEIEKIGNVDKIKDFDEIKNDISLLKKFKPVLLFLDKADASWLRNDRKKEIKWLLEALHLLIKMKVSRIKFDSFGFNSEVTNNKWTINYLKKRLIDAGYIPN